MKFQHYFLLIFISISLSCHKENVTPLKINIIPKPLSEKTLKGVFILNENTSLKLHGKFKNTALFFKSYLSETLGWTLTSNKSDHQIVFINDTTIKNEEGYHLTVQKNKILIAAKTEKGAFYAVQSLMQLIPLKSDSKNNAIPCVEIKDEPKFTYRGMHLDVARHFFSVDFIKKYINLMAMLKMNTFHWHLTEDQGWRIEIKKYPKLQTIAAYRDETLIGHYSDQPHKFDGKKYGGFYTQEEIKEIVKYASDRQITIIPEIEMPGHSQAAIAAYPELGCTGKHVKVATKWGVFNDIYCPKEATFQFLEDVINEVVTLFPGKYIHIGGDEAPKTNWKNCDHCQRLIKKEGLKDEQGLQSYFITRMEKYINAKGKQIIGWDEILEGGLAPNATVMSWRGTNGAVEAAKQKHNVILTPGSHCYFDHYQSDNENEPLAFGGFLPLEKVYDFNPVPKELTQEESKHVLGAQGNVWTEYIPNAKQVEYMAFPRAIALAEVTWSTPENKNYADFIKRLEFFHKRLDEMDVNYANHLYEINGEFKNENGQLWYTLTPKTKGKEIRYTTDYSEPNSTSTLYKKPLKITNSLFLRAGVFNTEGKQLGTIFNQKINLHKAVGQKITLSVPPHEAYNAGGKQALINGISGNSKRYGDKEWLGFSGEDVTVTIDFDEPTEINKISTRFYNGNGQWIYAPKQIKILLKNKNNESRSLTYNPQPISQLITPFNSDIRKLSSGTKIIKVSTLELTFVNYGVIPEEKQGAGHKAWTFIDEIIVE